MILKGHLFGYRINFVFRHRWEKGERVFSMLEWKTKELSIWYKTYLILSKPKKGPAVLGTNGTHSRSYLFGVTLIVCKFWFDICYRPLELKTN